MSGALTLAWVEGTYLGTTLNVTRFLPRDRADSAALVSAVQRPREFGPSSDDLPTSADGTP